MGLIYWSKWDPIWPHALAERAVGPTELRSYRQVFTQFSLTHGGFILALWLQLG